MQRSPCNAAALSCTYELQGQKASPALRKRAPNRNKPNFDVTLPSPKSRILACGLAERYKKNRPNRLTHLHRLSRTR